MESYILNKTPVRTANNFGINDIKLDIDLPTVKEFTNVMIMSEDIDKVELSDMNMGMVLSNKINSKIGLDINKNYTLTMVVPENVKIDNPILINFDMDEDNSVLVDQIKIVLKENAKADFILKYSSLDYCNNNCYKSDVCKQSVKKNNQRYFHNLKQITEADKNSKCSITIANMLDENSDSFISVENNLKENAKVEHTLVEFGGQNKISNYYSKLEGNFSENDIKTIYLGKHNDIIDINYNIEAYGEKTKCDINVQGAINDYAKKNFKGVIDFKEGAKKAKGFENENCTLLSSNAKSKSLPVLLCHEEDVEGQHGVASGKIDENKLFYIMTKGISYEDAKKLIVKANFSEIIRSIKNEDLQNDIIKMID